MNTQDLGRSLFSRRILFAILLSTIVFLACFHLFRLTPGHEWGDDFAGYILYGQNIAQGQSYGDIHLIENPSNIISPKAYPPVFPFLLSLIYRLFGLNLMAMKILIILFWQACLWLIFLLFRKKLSFGSCLWVLFLTSLHPFMYFFTNSILSEIPFLFFMLTGLLLAEYLYGNLPAQPKKHLYFLALGIVMYLAYGTRPIGAVFVPTLIAYDLFKHRRVHGETAIAVGVCLGLMIVQWFLGIDPAVYAKNFGFSMGAFLYKSAFYFAFFYVLTSVFSFKVFFWVTFFFFFVGFYGSLRKNFSLIEMFCLFYVGVVFLHVIPATFFDAQRLFIPMIPFAFYYIFLGTSEIVSFFNKKAAPVAGTLIFIIILALQISMIRKAIPFHRLQEYDVTNKEASELFDYIKNKTDPKDVFIFSKPRALTLFTQRFASTYHTPENAKDLWKYMQDIRVAYIVVFWKYDPYLKDFVTACDKKCVQVYQNKDFRIFKVKL
jgi:hypothetical protein